MFTTEWFLTIGAVMLTCRLFLTFKLHLTIWLNMPQKVLFFCFIHLVQFNNSDSTISGERASESLTRLFPSVIDSADEEVNAITKLRSLMIKHVTGKTRYRTVRSVSTSVQLSVVSQLLSLCETIIKFLFA
jgi:hypothetical protein